jgi:hypothetical protein
LGSQLWVAPDTSYYVELAGGIVERLDFRSQLFLIRPAGYPLLLAGIFAVFGGASATAILVIQHLMVVAVSLIIALIAWELTESRAGAFAAGAMSACSLQLIAFANVIMTEVPYTLALVAGAYFVIVYHLYGRPRSLALASLFAGISYLLRPVGMTLVAVCLLAALHRVLIAHRESDGRWFRRAAMAAMIALAPAFAVTLPGIIQNKIVHGGDLSRRCANLALYYRVVCMDKLDSRNSAALNDIRGVVAQAVAQGSLPPGTDHQQWGHVWKAYESVRGAGLAEASEMMGRAARDLIREFPGRAAALSIKYCYWILMVPDSFYRFQPGGAPGQITAEGESIRDAAAEIYSAQTYEPMMRRWTGPYEGYLHLQSQRPAGRFPRLQAGATALWTGINRWFYRHIEKGEPVLLLDSPYEAFTALCLVCGVASLATRRRWTWMLVLSLIALQIGVSAVLAGPTPRYAVPVKPLILLFPAMAVGAACAGWKLVPHYVGRVRFRLFQCSSRSERVGRSRAARSRSAASA